MGKNLYAEHFFAAQAEFDAWNWKTETLIVPGRAPQSSTIVPDEPSDWRPPS